MRTLHPSTLWVFNTATLLFGGEPQNLEPHT